MSGFNDQQAKGLAVEIKKVQDTHLNELASKADLLAAKIEIIKWVVGLLFAQTGLIIAAIKLLP